MDKFGRVDILMNNAGTGAVASADELLADRYLQPFTHDVSAPIPIPGGHHLTREGAAIVWRSILHDVE